MFVLLNYILLIGVTYIANFDYVHLNQYGYLYLLYSHVLCHFPIPHFTMPHFTKLIFFTLACSFERPYQITTYNRLN